MTAPNRALAVPQLVIQIIAICMTLVLPAHGEPQISTSEYKERVVEIIINHSVQGAGFLISEHGHILTARHVLDTTATTFSVEVKFIGDSTPRKAQVLDVHNYFDLAILKINPVSLPPPVTFGDSTALASNSPAFPQYLTAIGHPNKATGREHFEASTLAIRGADHRGKIVVGGSLLPGYSGAPAIDHASRVIGIIIEKNALADETYMMPIHYARYFLLGVDVDVLPGQPVDYRPELERLKRSMAEHENILERLRTDLSWTAKADKQHIYTSPLVSKIEVTDLAISYEKKFPEQYTPDAEIDVIFVPVFKNNDVDLATAKDQDLAVTQTKLFYGANKIVIQEVEASLKPLIEKINRKFNVHYSLKDIERLDITLRPKCKDPKVSFPSIAIQTGFPK